MIIKVAADADILTEGQCKQKDLMWTVAGHQPIRAGLPALQKILRIILIDGKGFNDMGYDVCLARNVEGEMVAGDVLDLDMTPNDYELKSGRTVYIRRLKATKLCAEIERTTVPCGEEFSVNVTAVDARGNRRSLPPQGRVRLFLKLLNPTELNKGATLNGKTMLVSGDGTRDLLMFTNLMIQRPGMFVIRCDYVNPRGTSNAVTPCSTQVFHVEADEHPTLSDVRFTHIGKHGFSLDFESTAEGHLCCLVFKSDEAEAALRDVTGTEGGGAAIHGTTQVRTLGQAHEITGTVGKFGSAEIRRLALGALEAEKVRPAVQGVERGIEQGVGHGACDGCLASNVFHVVPGKQTRHIAMQLVEHTTYSLHFMTDNLQGTNPSNSTGCLRVTVTQPPLPSPEFESMQVECLPGGADGLRVTFDAKAAAYMHYCVSGENLYHPTRATEIVDVAARLHGAHPPDDEDLDDSFYTVITRTRAGVKPVIPVKTPARHTNNAQRHALWKHAGTKAADDDADAPLFRPSRREDVHIYAAGNVVVGKGLGHTHVLDVARPLMPGGVYDFWYAPHPIDTADLRQITRGELDQYPLERTTFVVPFEDPPEVRCVTLVQVNDLPAVRLRFELSAPGSVHYIVCERRANHGMTISPTAVIRAAMSGTMPPDGGVVCAGTFLGIPSGPHSFRLGHLPNRNVEHTHFPCGAFEIDTPYEAFVLGNNTTLGNAGPAVAFSANPIVLHPKPEGGDGDGGTDRGADEASADPVGGTAFAGDSELAAGMAEHEDAVALALRQNLDESRTAALANARRSLKAVMGGEYGEPPAVPYTPGVPLPEDDAGHAGGAETPDDFESIGSDDELTLALLQAKARFTAGKIAGGGGDGGGALRRHPPLPKMSDALMRELMDGGDDSESEARGLSEARAAGVVVPARPEEDEETWAAPLTEGAPGATPAAVAGGEVQADGTLAPFVELDPSDPAVLKFFAPSSHDPGDAPDLAALQSLLSEGGVGAWDADDDGTAPPEGAKQKAKRIWKEYHCMLARIADLESTLKTCQVDLATATDEYETYRTRLDRLVDEVKQAKTRQQELQAAQRERDALHVAETELECGGIRRELAEVQAGNEAWAGQCQIVDERNAFLTSTLEALRISKTSYIHALQERCVRGRVEALAIPDHTDDVFELREVKKEQDAELCRLREILAYFTVERPPDPPRTPRPEPPVRPSLHTAEIITRRLAIPSGGLRVLTTIRGGGLQALRFKHDVNAAVVAVTPDRNELEVTGEPHNVLACIKEVEAIYEEMKHIFS